MNSKLVYLAQTDTTVGFLSSDDKKLSSVKRRDPGQKTLKVVDGFKTLKRNTRVPKAFRNRVRRSKKTTFIYPNGGAFRVVGTDSHHYSFINKLGSMYSTSANITKQDFNEEFAVENSDVIVYNNLKFSQSGASKIYKINNHKIKRIR